MPSITCLHMHAIIVECLMNDEWFYTGYALNATSPSLMAIAVYAHLQLQQPYTYHLVPEKWPRGLSAEYGSNV